jgi:ADP-ribose pyrophosphatase
VERKAFVNSDRQWAVKGSTPVFTSPHLEVRAETILTPGSEQERKWITVHRKHAVVIAPITAQGRLILIHQARIPVREVLWEFPAGQIDQMSEPDFDTIRQVAIRELTEETGYQLEEGGEFLSLGIFYSSPGFTDETQHLFIARPVRAAADAPDPEETEAIFDVREFTAAELREMIAGRIIQDGNTLALYAKMAAGGLL